jgi:hypothetical protein
VTSAVELVVAMAEDDRRRHAAAPSAAFALCGRPVVAEVDHGFDAKHPESCSVCALAVVLDTPPGEQP